MLCFGCLLFRLVCDVFLIVLYCTVLCVMAWVWWLSSFVGYLVCAMYWRLVFGCLFLGDWFCGLVGLNLWIWGCDFLVCCGGKCGGCLFGFEVVLWWLGCIALVGFFDCDFVVCYMVCLCGIVGCVV